MSDPNLLRNAEGALVATEPQPEVRPPASAEPKEDARSLGRDAWEDLRKRPLFWVSAALIVLVALVGAKGDAGKVKSLEDVGEDELVGEREADDVERAERSGTLEGEQGHVPFAHERGHVRPGEVGALAGHAVLLVDAPVENRDAEVGLTDLVGVRVGQAPAHRD